MTRSTKRVNGALVREKLKELLEADYSKQDIIAYIQEEFQMTQKAVASCFYRIAQTDKEVAEKLAMTVNVKPSARKKDKKVAPVLELQTKKSPEIIEAIPIIKNNNPALDDFRLIIKTFAERWHTPTPDEIEGLQEYYIILSNRGLDAVLWITSCIKEIAKKNPQKHNMSYLISLIRHRMIKGWGVSNNEEEEIIVKEIEKVVNRELTLEQRSMVYRLMGQYGGVKLSLMISKINVGELFMRELLNSMKEYDKDFTIRKQLNNAQEVAQEVLVQNRNKV